VTDRNGDHAITRSQEEMSVGTVWRPRERLRLRKVIVTEHVTVAVRREELRVERVPLDGDAAADPPAPVPEREMVLYEERPVVEVVPRERVRLRVETVTAQEEVAEELRRERIGLDTHPERRENR
jgi:stress response protein YsnF